jgi:DNA ligase (NAD+)
MMEETKLLNLIDLANNLARDYESGHPTVSDKEWDDLYFQIQELEEKLGIYYKHSPTQHIPYDVVNQLNKVEHGHKMLSLQKTKDLSEIEKFLDNCDSLIMLKMDGLTCSLTYIDGELVSAETRGNGIIGEDILHNALQIRSIPNYIPRISGKLVVDGEIICTTKNFEMFASEYKNPRNFAAGSIRLLDSKECAKRKLSFIAWDVIEGLDQYDLLSERLAHIANYGFTVVPYVFYPAWDAADNDVPLEDMIDHLKIMAEKNGYPIDGAVAKFNSVPYGKTLGETSHHFKNAMAYKFYDETYETELIDIEWTMGRTGVLTPVAVFKPIDIDGSTVERASLHNVSIMIETLHGYGWKGQKVEVFKANMIIPQIASAELDDDRCKYYFERVMECPVCGHEVILKNDNGTTFAVCSNDACEGKLINRLDHFCGKKGLDIKGLSKATLEKVIDWGWVSNRHRLFMLKYYRDEWINKPGFGEKSVDKILTAIETASNTEFHQYLSSLGIPLIGVSASKELAKHFKNYAALRIAMENDFKFYELPNFGIEMHKALYNYDWLEADAMIGEHSVTFKDSITETVQDTSLDGLTFVITGKLNHFKNRDAIKDKIESLGGKVTGSVSKNTSYLINNDKDSTSSKNKSAKSLGIPILSEEDFIKTFGIE